MGKARRDRAKREAQQIAHLHTQREEGRWLGKIEPDSQPIAAELIRQFQQRASTLHFKACPHLKKDQDQVKFWVQALPELLACKACTVVLAKEETKQANTRCIMCERHVALRGFSVTVNDLLLRGGVCQQCEGQHGVSLS